MRIVLVDDDEDDRQFFSDALSQLNMDVELLHFENGSACLDYLENNPENTPNLVFLDLNMPIMNGFECLEHIRRKEQLRDLIVAIYSTSSAEQDIETTFSKGANIYITKPSSFKSLKDSLKKVIRMNWAIHMNDFKKESFLLRV